MSKKTVGEKEEMNKHKQKSEKKYMITTKKWMTERTKNKEGIIIEMKKVREKSELTRFKYKPIVYIIILY